MQPPPQSLQRPLQVPEKLLAGPGPSNAPRRVLDAGRLPLLGHLHAEFTQGLENNASNNTATPPVLDDTISQKLTRSRDIKIMDDVKAGIQYAFQTKNKITLAVSATGHGAMEAACVNMVEAGDVVLVAENGIWGQRFKDMAQRNGAVVHTVKKDAGQTFTPYDVEVALQTHRPQLMFITHGESSGTTCQALEHLGKICHQHGCLLLVDSVAAMGAVPLYMDKWEIDVLYTGSQKVLSAPPGLSPISFSPAAWEKIQKRSTKVRSFYFDMNWLANYWGCDGQPRKYHHTAPISTMYALREGLALLAEEGLTTCWERHRECTALLHNGITQMGLQLFVKDPNSRLPVVTGVVVPPGVDWKKVVGHAMKKRVEISGGLGETAGRIWRIGLMGHNAKPENARKVLSVLKEALQHAGTPASKL